MFYSTKADLLSETLSLRSRASDHTENGDPWLHASSHPGDAGELWGTGGARSRGRKRKRRSQEGGGRRTGKLPFESDAQTGPFSQPEPRSPLPLLSFPSLHLRLHNLQTAVEELEQSILLQELSGLLVTCLDCLCWQIMVLDVKCKKANTFLFNDV